MTRIDRGERDSGVERRAVPLFFASAAASFLGTYGFVYALVIYSGSEGSPRALAGQVYLLATLPVALIGLYTGLLCDRRSKRRLLLASQLLCAAAALLVAASTGQRGGSWSLRAAALLAGCSFAFVGPSRLALAGDLLSSVDLVERGTVTLTLLQTLAFAGGPVLIGWIRARADWGVVFAAVAAFWGLATVALSGMSSPPAAQKASVSLQAGLRYLRAQRLQAELVVLTALLAVFALGPFQVLVPSFAVDVLGLDEQQRGLLMAVFGVGNLAGVICAGLLLGREPRGALLVGASAACGGALVWLSQTVNPWTAGAALAAAGGAGALAGALALATLQRAVHPDYRGRVLALYGCILGGFPALGGFVAGQLADRSSGGAALLIMGGALAVTSLVCARACSSLRMQRAPAAIPLGQPAFGHGHE